MKAVSTGEEIEYQKEKLFFTGEAEAMIRKWGAEKIFFSSWEEIMEQFQIELEGRAKIDVMCISLLRHWGGPPKMR